MLIDISPPLRNDMPVYPGNPPFSLRVVRRVEEGAHSTLSEITMGTHSGTHVDAPAHFLPGGAPLDAMPLEALVGRALVEEIVADGEIPAEAVQALGVADGTRLLLKTGNSALWGSDSFNPDYAYLSTEAASYLATRRLLCLGVDYLSVGGFHSNGTEVHRVLLEAGVLLIEGLDLSGAAPGEYDLVCLPLPLAGAEAAPARAVLRTL